MDMKIILVLILAAAVVAGSVAVALTMTGNNEDVDPEDDPVTPVTPTEDDDDDDDDDPESEGESTSIDDLTITYYSGTEDCYTITSSNGEYTVTFSGITEDTLYGISGKLTGNIVVDAGDYAFELDLEGVTITSSLNAPIYADGEDFALVAKKGTTNTINDGRSAVSSTSTTDTTATVSASIYTLCDTDIKGKGTLNVNSTNNNGIHCKKDLDVKNLTLTVKCVDNALKGNDSVDITSGTINLYAYSGDGILTTNSDISSSGNQRGTVTINSEDGDTVVTINAYCDGIDAAYDVVIEELTTGSVTVKIYTYTYASLSSVQSLASFAAPGGGSFAPGQSGQDSGQGSWGQAGPDSEGNSNTVDFSCKGIKVANSATIESGTVLIYAYDDAIHSNLGTLENGSTGTGAITIEDGTLTLKSKDDAMHADGTLTINGGDITISEAYEGLEGLMINITDGDISITSSDDGINGFTNTSNSTTEGIITLTGGTLYIYAGGDGIDSNNYGQYTGIVFDGADVTIISNGQAESSIDTNNGYTYKSGKVLAICQSGMTQEVSMVSNWSSVATYKTMSLSSGSTVKVTVSGSTVASVTMPCSISNAYVVYLGSNSATIST